MYNILICLKNISCYLDLGQEKVMINTKREEVGHDLHQDHEAEIQDLNLKGLIYC